MGRGSYLGGSTIIGPGSSWFSDGTKVIKKAKKPKLSPEEQEAKRIRLAAQFEAKAAKKAARAKKLENLRLRQEAKKRALAEEKQRKAAESAVIKAAERAARLKDPVYLAKQAAKKKKAEIRRSMQQDRPYAIEIRRKRLFK